MPRYEYKCPQGHRVELLRKISERNDPVPCGSCPPTPTGQQPPMELVMSAPAGNFPGADRWR